jgi:hypothetical protein
MEIESNALDFSEGEYVDFVVQKKADWNGRAVTLGYSDQSSEKTRHAFGSYQITKEEEIEKLKQSLPSKKQDPEKYYTQKARIEQLRYEIEIKKAGKEALKGHLSDAVGKYGSASSHQRKKARYEEKANQARLNSLSKAGKLPKGSDPATR